MSIEVGNTFTSTGTNSWTAHWSYERDVIAQLRKSMGDDFPRNYDCRVRRDGEFHTGNPKYLWVVVDTETDKQIAQRTAIQRTSRKGQPYYQVRRFANQTE